MALGEKGFPVSEETKHETENIKMLLFMGREILKMKLTYLGFF